jgi:hypothetical protein
VNEVWIITEKRRETYGHGDFGESYKLPTVGAYDSGGFHPAFTSEAAAREYLGTLQYGKHLTPARLELKQ